MAQSQQIVAKQWEELVLATSDHDTDVSFLFKEAYSKHCIVGNLILPPKTDNRKNKPKYLTNDIFVLVNNAKTYKVSTYDASKQVGITKNLGKDFMEMGVLIKVWWEI